MAFKLGSENRDFRTFKKPMVFRKHLEDGVKAEANNDGSIYIDQSVKPGSKEEVRIIKHEMKHVHDIETGRADYGDDWVMWEDNYYFRKTINGVNVIDGPNGRWPEGDKNHPWEAEAIQAEKQ